MKFIYFLTESPAEVKKLKAHANSVNSDKSQKEIYNALVSHGIIQDKYYDISNERIKAAEKIVRTNSDIC